MGPPTGSGHHLAIVTPPGWSIARCRGQLGWADGAVTTSSFWRAWVGSLALREGDRRRRAFATSFERRCLPTAAYAGIGEPVMATDINDQSRANRPSMTWARAPPRRLENRVRCCHRAVGSGFGERVVWVAVSLTFMIIPVVGGRHPRRRRRSPATHPSPASTRRSR